MIDNMNTSVVCNGRTLIRVLNTKKIEIMVVYIHIYIMQV